MRAWAREKVQSKREVGWGLGPEQDPFMKTFFIMGNRKRRTAAGLGDGGSEESCRQQSVQGSPWLVEIRTVAHFFTTCSAWQRT